jgi:hypothetical protein
MTDMSYMNSTPNETFAVTVATGSFRKISSVCYFLRSLPQITRIDMITISREFTASVEGPTQILLVMMRMT